MGKISNAIRGTALALDKQAQMVALDKEFSEMEAKVKYLEAEKLHLEAKVNPLEREVEGLKKQIQKQEAPSDNLDEFQEALLYAISKAPDVTTEDLAAGANKSEEAVTFHLVEMMQSHLIGDRYDIEGRHWYLKQEGRRYLNKIGKL